MIASVRTAASSLPVSDRLIRPHPIIAGWLADREERKREARRERDPWLKALKDPGELSDTDHRRHRLLDALFKNLERNRAHVKQGDRNALFVEVLGEPVEFQLREKHKQGRRPLTTDEQRWRSPGGKDWKQELLPTGRLEFTIKTRLPEGLKTQWLETDETPLEDSVPDIVASFVAAGPLLVKQRHAREEAQRQRQMAEHRVYEEGQRRKRENNRWRRFTELARDWRDLAIAREFLATLKVLGADPNHVVEDRSMQEWMGWAEERLRMADPLSDGVEGVFTAVALMREWSYRD